MNGKKYYNILGLEPGASDDAVKKQFRKLAKAYHPDKNPNEDATAIFQELLDAYERILKRDFGEQKSKATKSNQEKQEDAYREMHRRAWERYQTIRKEEERALQAFYSLFISGWRMHLKRAIALISLLIFSAFIADLWLPIKSHKERIASYNRTRYQSTGDHFVNEIITRNGESYFIADYQPSKFEKNNQIIINETAICRLVQSITHRSEFETKNLEVHFTFYWARYVLYFFLIHSMIMAFYRRRNTMLVVGSWFVYFVVGITLFIFLLSDFRLISLISIGSWP